MLAKQQAKAMHPHNVEQRRGSSTAVVAWNASTGGANDDDDEVPNDAFRGPSAPPSSLSGGCNPLLEERLAGFTVRTKK
jgi:hypothetical protein